MHSMLHKAGTDDTSPLISQFLVLVDADARYFRLKHVAQSFDVPSLIREQQRGGVLHNQTPMPNLLRDDSMEGFPLNPLCLCNNLFVSVIQWLRREHAYVRLIDAAV